MMNPTEAPAIGRSIARRLRLSELEELCTELQPWRTDPVFADIPPSVRSHLLFPFAKGLRLSARLIYVLRDALSSFDCCVNWGQLLADERLCSPECDVIIHRPGHVRRWNGHDGRVMDFHFVDAGRALAVVSCKSLMTRVDRQYARKMKDYVADVFLFAECCKPGKADRLKAAALEAGYQAFGYLYTFEIESGKCENRSDVWEEFLKTLASRVRQRMVEVPSSGSGEAE